MEFTVKKDDLLKGIRIVEQATALKGLQPVLANILIESSSEASLKFSATDLDLTIMTEVPAQVNEDGKITLPAKKLSDIVSKLTEDFIEFKIEDNSANIKCKNTKFSLIGISANEFPQIQEINLDEETAINIDIATLNRGIKQVEFAAAGYESNNLLSGVVFSISENVLEMASTDGNRLARVREEIKTKTGEGQMIIPSKTLQEFVKISSFLSDENVKLYIDRTKLIIKSENTTIISRLMEGQYPKYNQLIPKESPKDAVIKLADLVSALERVAIMVNEKTNIVKFVFADNKLVLSADTPDSGASEDEIDIKYEFEELKIAFNYKYVLDAIRNMNAKSIKIGLNTPLSATIIKPDSEDDYISLIMPVQMRN